MPQLEKIKSAIILIRDQKSRLSPSVKKLLEQEGWVKKTEVEGKIKYTKGEKLINIIPYVAKERGIDNSIYDFFRQEQSCMLDVLSLIITSRKSSITNCYLSREQGQLVSLYSKKSIDTAIEKLVEDNLLTIEKGSTLKKTDKGIMHYQDLKNEILGHHIFFTPLPYAIQKAKIESMKLRLQANWLFLVEFGLSAPEACFLINRSPTYVTYWKKDFIEYLKMEGPSNRVGKVFKKIYPQDDSGNSKPGQLKIDQLHYIADELHKGKSIRGIAKEIGVNYNSLYNFIKKGHLPTA